MVPFNRILYINWPDPNSLLIILIIAMLKTLSGDSMTKKKVTLCKILADIANKNLKDCDLKPLLG